MLLVLLTGLVLQRKKIEMKSWSSLSLWKKVNCRDSVFCSTVPLNVSNRVTNYMKTTVINENSWFAENMEVWGTLNLERTMKN